MKARVTPDEKQKFKGFVEESNEVDSMSRLLRLGALRFIATSEGEQQASVDPDDIASAMEGALSDVTERLERMDDKIAELDVSVRSSDDIQQLTHEIVSNLPVADDGSELPDISDIDAVSPEDIRFARSLSTVTAWADYFGEDEDKVRRALARAQEFPDVQFAEGSMGYRRYYKTSEGS